MTIIKGPIHFKRGEIPEQIKEYFKKNGLDTPFNNMRSYSNTKIDDWFRLKKDGKLLKFDRTGNKFVEDKLMIDN